MSVKKLVVMKFGGTSVANPERILSSAKKVIKAKKQGLDVVVVVSAPGEMTDELVDLARNISPEPDRREMDMLLATGEQISIALFAIALKSQGAMSVSLTGGQAGILSTNSFTTAKIVGIKPKKILECLGHRKVVVVAGFQGMNAEGEITHQHAGLNGDISEAARALAMIAK